MVLDKKYNNIYLVSAIIAGAFIFMAVTTWEVVGDVNNESSVDIAIDKRIDQCWEEKGLDDKGLVEK